MATTQIDEEYSEKQYGGTPGYSSTSGYTGAQQASHQPDQYRLGGAGEETYMSKREGDTSDEHISEKEDPEERQAEDPPKPPHKGPAGGYDSTPIPKRPTGYNVRITFHRASKLPIADLPTLSSDPYLLAHLSTDDPPSRNKEDPPLTFRSRTLFSTLEPEWEEEWILQNIPAGGFKLKVRIYDEDRGDADDRLGNAHINVDRIDEHWEGIKDGSYKIKKRMGSKRAYLLRAVAVCFRQAKEMSGNLHVSVEVLGRSPDSDGGRIYTVGPQYWCRHYAPLLGRITGIKTADNESDDDGENGAGHDEQNAGPSSDNTNGNPNPSQIPGAGYLSKKNKREARSSKPAKYNFQANQVQLQGPVPPELYHRYVEFRPFIKALFTARGVRGIIMQKALHHQHAQVYNFNRETKYGVFRQGPCWAMTQRFLDLCHGGEGGRMFTYVISLDALWRFTETGKEFGIDLLSKHSMHSDAANYIAFSGEFFIRRRQDGHNRRQKSSSRGQNNDSHTEEDSTQQDSNTKSKVGPITHTSTGAVQPPAKASKTKIALNDQNPSDIGHSSGAQPPSDDTRTPTVGHSKFDRTERPRQPNRSISTGYPYNPSHFELIIDNDSGTYRPNAALLPRLHSFMSTNLPGLKVITLDCQKDEALMGRLKGQQRRIKEETQRRNGGRVVYQQDNGSSSSSSSGSSMSSDDVEALDRRAENNMLEDAYGRGGGAGRQKGRTDDRPPSTDGMHSESVQPSSRREGQQDGGQSGGQPKHKMGEAVLPYVNHGKARNHLTTDGANDEMDSTSATKQGPYPTAGGAGHDQNGIQEGEWDGSLSGDYGKLQHVYSDSDRSWGWSGKSVAS